MSAPAAEVYIFPPALITRADLARLVREVEAIDNELESQKARNRTTGKTGYRVPNLSKSLGDFVDLNKVDFANDQKRMHLKEQLNILKDKAPIMHMTFAVEADPGSLQYLVQYLRTQVHPQTLLSVGLQPALIGGAYVRTPNHIHDFTLRARLAENRDLIGKELKSFSNVIPVVEAPAEEAPAPAAAAPAATATPATPATASAPAPAAERKAA
ncbi:MAG TPA: hypothetical protein VLF59_03905 [Candidatus Saccharimonadales bacterium]|nr:hypothetical protein [Candidatus Saccharimonadales bacterium]